jgi:sec-independent protein translocase protein TatC
MFEEIKPHLYELRKRLGISLASVVVLFFVMFSVWQPILSWMTAPLIEVLPEGSSVIFTKVQEPFFTALKVAFFTGFIAALPIIFWQIWLFIAPGLYASEKKMVIPFVVGATVMFLIGGLFCYYVVIPFGYDFLINFGSQLFTALPSIGEYVSFFTKLIMGFGIAFELPVFTFLFASMGLVTDQTLIGFFRYALIIIFIVAALLTPPDILTQFLMAGPMILLYGLSILIARTINPEIKEEDEQS